MSEPRQAYLPGFQNDLFISYCHLDNQPLGADQVRWIDFFHETFEKLVQSHLGDRPQIWRDRKLAGMDAFSDEIESQLQRSAVLVSVLSRAYLKSDWCQREFRAFQDAAAASGGLKIGNKQRIVKVVKTPVLRTDLPEVLDAMTGYEFYSRDEATQKVRDYLLEPSQEGRRAYWAKVNDVAQEVVELLDALRTRDAARAPKATLYLAQTTSDLQAKRDQLERELRDRSYEVLPARPLPLGVADVIQAVRADLARSRLSIHLFGARYGLIPEGETRSLAVLQNAVAAEQHDPTFARIVWLPPGLEVQEDAQRQFVEGLRRASGSRNGLELLESSFEDLKSVILDKLTAAQRAAAAPSDQRAAKTHIYLLCVAQDRKAIGPLRGYLFDRGFEVKLPLMQGDPEDVRKDHEANLTRSDAVVIWWGQGDEAWLRQMQNDLLRALGLRQARPFRACAVYIGGPAREEKNDFRTNEALVMRNAGDFTPADVQPFLEAVAQRP